MSTELTGVKDVDDIIYEYVYGMEHREKMKKVFKEMKEKYTSKICPHQYICHEICPNCYYGIL